jgi:hypothetical protein
MGWLRVKLPVALLILAFASYVVFLEVQASNQSDEQIGSSAVWNVADHDLAQINQTCRAAQGLDYTSCFIAQMPNFGASTEAVSFTQTFARENHGMVAFLKAFHPVDSVDVGYAFFPAAADFNQRWLLLNGAPAIINVDDFGLLPQADMAKDPNYVALRKQFPQMALFDGDRALDVVPEIEALPDGRQWFHISYPLKNKCRACAVVGSARYGFEFDPAGRLTQVKFLEVSPVEQPAQK